MFLRQLSHLATSENGYKEAWGILKKTYEKKRIVIANNFDQLTELSTPNTINSTTLSDIVDVVRQNGTSLKVFDVEIDERFVVRLVERILPPSIRGEWEREVSLEQKYETK